MTINMFKSQSLFRLSLLLIITLASFFSLASLSDLQIKQLDQQLAENEKRYGVVGQSVLILKNHQPIYRGMQGYANLELDVKVKSQHIFPNYSVAKLFTNVVVFADEHVQATEIFETEVLS